MEGEEAVDGMYRMRGDYVFKNAKVILTWGLNSAEMTFYDSQGHTMRPTGILSYLGLDPGLLLRVCD